MLPTLFVMSSNHSSTYYSTSSFGPVQPDALDFTLLFEDTFLSILPSAVLLLVLPFRLLSLWGKPRKVSRSFLYENKLLFLMVYACMQATLLVLHATTPVLRSRATLVAATLTLFASIFLCTLSRAEHINSVRPSAIINVYLIITLPFDVARSRTLWLDGVTKPVAAVFTSAVCLKAMILILEAVEKRSILLDRYRYSSPEVTSGIYSRSFFWWLNNLMTIGFCRVITHQDLYPIDDDMTSQVLSDRAHVTWKSTDQTRRRALLWSILRATRPAFLYGIFPRICLIGFRYAQPFLLSRAVNFSNNPEEPNSTGWGLTAAFGLVFLGMAISSGAYYHMTYRFLVSVRGSLVGLVYAKTIDLSVTALDESVAVTLMSNDTEAICEGFQNLQELWAVPVELGIALLLLERELGLAFLAPTAVAAISVMGIAIIAKYMGNAQKIWIEGIQTRVDVTSSMLSSMKSVKMLGFTDILVNIIQGLRIAELQLSNQFRKLLVVRVFLGNSMGALAPWATFAIFVISAKTAGRTLNTASAYTALSLISLLATPMNTLVRTIPSLNAALACLDRIENFLKSDARQDHRLPLFKISEPEPRASPQFIEGIKLEPLGPLSYADANSTIIAAQNASFAWTTNGPPTVSNLNFNIQRHQICFIIGPVGSGKSTLLKGLLGETPSTQGFVYSTAPETAFVDQSPWVRNGTIQENILATVVGSAGISLSGGQKQRVALARAVYAKKELIILDDVFSGLDAETEEHIFALLLGKGGLFRSMGTTVLLATHAVQRLRYADHIIALDSKGNIAEQGSFQQLNDTSGYVQSFSAKFRPEESTQTRETVTATKSTPTMSVDADEIDPRMENLNRQTGDFAVYKYYFSSVGLFSSLLFVSYVVLFGVASKMTEFLITFWTKAVEARGNKVNAFYIGMYTMLVGFSLVGLLLAIVQLALVMVPRSAKKLHEELLRTVMGAPLAFFSKTDTGTITNRFSQDMSVIDTELPYSLIDLVFSFVLTLMSAILMCLSAGYFAATMPPVILAVYVLQKYYLRTSRQMRLLDLEAKSPLYSHFLESLSGLVTIRAFGWGENFQVQNHAFLNISQKPYYLLFCIQRWLALILDLLVMVLAVILMILVVKLRNGISPGYVGLALLNVTSFNAELALIITNWTQLETSIGAISRLKNFSIQTVSENLPGENQTVSLNWPAHGAIEFNNVSASYTSDDNLVVRNLSISIKAGEKIGVYGRSGSGKSSLIATLFCMLEITPKSSIKIDGIDIKTLPRQLVRSRLNAIPQEPYFIRGTVRSNADPDHLHTNAAIIAAIQKVQLWELILSKGGLDTELDSDFFSHGQRQLFCLVRAILRESKVVILDEVTSSVDPKSDDLMQQVIRREFADCTIIAVAHRLDTILDFDRIALLSKGELIEFDTPQALLGRPSAFRELYNS